MTPEQKKLIRDSFRRLLAEPDETAALFYARLFEQEPALRPMFQRGMKQQGRKFMDMMDAILSCLDRLDQVVPLLWQMGKRHGGYGVETAHYAMVGAALVWTLEERLGTAFTPETRAAWTELYGLISATMQQAASEGIIPRPSH